MAIYSPLFLTMQSQNKPAFVLYQQDSSSICHSDCIPDHFKATREKITILLLHVNIQMRWPDPYPCGWSLPFLLSRVRKCMMPSGGPPGQRADLWNQFWAGKHTPNHSNGITRSEMPGRYHTNLMLNTEIGYWERHQTWPKSRPTLLHSSWRAGRIGS